MYAHADHTVPILDQATLLGALAAGGSVAMAAGAWLVLLDLRRRRGSASLGEAEGSNGQAGGGRLGPAVRPDGRGVRVAAPPTSGGIDVAGHSSDAGAPRTVPWYRLEMAVRSASERTRAAADLHHEAGLKLDAAQHEVDAVLAEIDPLRHHVSDEPRPDRASRRGPRGRPDSPA